MRRLSWRVQYKSKNIEKTKRNINVSFRRRAMRANFASVIQISLTTKLFMRLLHLGWA